MSLHGDVMVIHVTCLAPCLHGVRAQSSDKGLLIPTCPLDGELLTPTSAALLGFLSQQALTAATPSTPLLRFWSLEIRGTQQGPAGPRIKEDHRPHFTRVGGSRGIHLPGTQHEAPFTLVSQSSSTWQGRIPMTTSLLREELVASSCVSKGTKCGEALFLGRVL